MRSRDRQQQADAAHVERSQPDHPPADPHAPCTVAGSDGLPHEGGPRRCDAEPGHVGDGSQHHGHLGCGAVDGPDAHLHHLKERQAEQIGCGQQAGGKSEPQLRPQPLPVRPPGQVGFELRSSGAAEEKSQADDQSDGLRHARRPSGAGDAPGRGGR